MATTCRAAFAGTTRLDTERRSFVGHTAGLSSSSCGINNGAFRAVEMRGVSIPVRKSLQVVSMAPPKPAGKAKKGIRADSVVEDC